MFHKNGYAFSETSKNLLTNGQKKDKISKLVYARAIIPGEAEYLKMQRCLSGLRSTTGNRVYVISVPRVQIPLSAPRATAFEPSGKWFAIHFLEWCRGHCCQTASRAEEVRKQLQCSRNRRQICQTAVMRKRAAGKPVALFLYPNPVPPDRLKRRCFFVIVYRY